MCLINNDHVIGLTATNPLEAVVRRMRESKQCFCTGKGHDGFCACERRMVPLGAIKALPDTWQGWPKQKPRIRVKANSVRY